MIKVATILCAQLAVSAVALSMSGAAFAQDIGCVNGIPAPPITHSCPSTSPTRSFAEAPAGRIRPYTQKHRSFDPATGTYLGRNGVRHVFQ
jgi:hypothetical protein